MIIKVGGKKECKSQVMQALAIATKVSIWFIIALRREGLIYYIVSVV